MNKSAQKISRNSMETNYVVGFSCRIMGEFRSFGISGFSILIIQNVCATISPQAFPDIPRIPGASIKLFNFRKTVRYASQLWCSLEICFSSSNKHYAGFPEQQRIILPYESFTLSLRWVFLSIYLPMCAVCVWLLRPFVRRRHSTFDVKCIFCVSFCTHNLHP